MAAWGGRREGMGLGLAVGRGGGGEGGETEGVFAMVVAVDACWCLGAGD